MHTGTHAFGCF